VNRPAQFRQVQGRGRHSRTGRKAG
jgi:hypothetical protein